VIGSTFALSQKRRNHSSDGWFVPSAAAQATAVDVPCQAAGSSCGSNLASRSQVSCVMFSTPCCATAANLGSKYTLHQGDDDLPRLQGEAACEQTNTGVTGEGYQHLFSAFNNDGWWHLDAVLGFTNVPSCLEVGM